MKNVFRKTVKTVNPETGRFIKTDGPVYRDLVSRGVINPDTPQKWSTVVIPVGETLYHGTTYQLPTGIPTRDANWFAVERKQSEYHAILKLRESIHDDCRSGKRQRHAYLYEYVTQKPLKLLNFGDYITNYLEINQKYDNEDVTPFSESNIQLATSICHEKQYDGWVILDDQSEVMLCHPSESLSLVQSYRYNLSDQDVLKFCQQMQELPDYSNNYELPSSKWPSPYNQLSEQDIKAVDDGDIASWIWEEPIYDKYGMPKMIWNIRNKINGNLESMRKAHPMSFSRLKPLRKKNLRQFI